jgi:hypothetical protein
MIPVLTQNDSTITILTSYYNDTLDKFHSIVGEAYKDL